MNLKKSELSSSSFFIISSYLAIIFFIGFLFFGLLLGYGSSIVLLPFLAISGGIFMVALPIEIIRIAKNQEKLYDMIVNNSGEKPTTSK